MRRLYPIVRALIVLGFIGTAVFLVFAPDTVAAHFNAAGEPDRYGSKYEALLLPAVSALMGGAFLLCARAAGKRGAALYERIFLWTALGEVALFHGIGAYAMWKMSGGGSGSGLNLAGGVDYLRLTSVLVGLLLVLLGNVMPKARRNGLFGVRTAWSLSGGEAWRKSPRFGGFASVAAGLLLALLGVVLEGWASLAALTAVLTLWALACVAASYRYSRCEKGGESEYSDHS